MNKTFILLFTFIVLSVSSVVDVQAQALDKNIIESLGKGKLGKSGAETPLLEGTAPFMTGQQADISKIREQRRLMQEERVQDMLTGQPSPVERDYWLRLGVKTEEGQEDFSSSEYIRQYGYNIASTSIEAQPKITGRIPGNYVLGVGDELIITFTGADAETFVSAVDADGRLMVSDLPPLRAAGQSFSQFEAALVSLVKKQKIGADVYVSLGRLRQISVLVAGEVNVAGSYALTNLSGPLEALSAAGGIKKSGTLRNIQIVGSGKARTLDLYKLQTEGQGSDIYLEDGDKIVVSTVGHTVAIVGNVIREGIYELSPANDSLPVADALKMAGGSIRPRGNQIARQSVDSMGRERLIAAPSMNDIVSAGDVLYVRSPSNFVAGSISMSGHVSAPGTVSLDENTSLRSLLDGREVFGADPYLPFAILETTHQATQARILKAVSLERILSQAEDIKLKDKDDLYVLSNEEVRFLTSPELRDVLVYERLDESACPILKDFARWVRHTGRERFDTALRSVFVTDIARERTITGDQSVNKAMAVIGKDTSNVMIEGEAVRDSECPMVYGGSVARLSFALEHAVSITGGVQRPGAYPASGDVSVESLAAVAGGFVKEVDHQSVEVSMYDTSEQRTISRLIDGSKVPLSSVTVSSGASVRFNILENDKEMGTVLLSGEFANPGVYSIRKGETLREVIARAGGTTDFSYPLGAVMTRESVVKQQQEGLRRMAREIDNALAVAAVKSDLSSQTVEAARMLTDRIASAEAVGRMVVEADPAVLRSKPELDTILEGGDRVHMPKRPNFVLVAGDVLNPGAMQFQPGKSVKSYLEEAGGYQASADDDRIFLVYPNGVAKPANISSWMSGSDVQIPPGSTIVVPKDLNPVTGLEIVRDITGIFGQLALSAASLVVIFGN